MFTLLKKYIDKKFRATSEGPETNQQLKKELELLVAFIRFSIKSYPLRTDYVNYIL